MRCCWLIKNTSAGAAYLVRSPSLLTTASRCQFSPSPTATCTKTGFRTFVWPTQRVCCASHWRSCVPHCFARGGCCERRWGNHRAPFKNKTARSPAAFHSLFHIVALGRAQNCAKMSVSRHDFFLFPLTSEKMTRSRLRTDARGVHMRARAFSREQINKQKSPAVRGRERKRGRDKAGKLLLRREAQPRRPRSRQSTSAARTTRKANPASARCTERHE